MRNSVEDQRIRRFIGTLTLGQKMELLLHWKLEQDPGFILRVLSGSRGGACEPRRLSMRRPSKAGICKIAS